MVGPLHLPERHVLRVHMPNALSVYVMGPFNNWSTAATPMQRGPQGQWQIELPEGADPASVGFFVWEPGRRFGRVHHIPESLAG